MKIIHYIIVLFIASFCLGRNTASSNFQKITSKKPDTIHKEAPAIPGMIVVKKRAILAKGNEAAWHNGLQRIHALSVSPAFPKHVEKPSALASIFQVEIHQDANVYKAAEKLMENPDVEWAEPVYIRRLSYDPDDPEISSQWHIAKLQCPLAWDISQGDATVVIGIIDTGIELDHPDLKDNLWKNPNEIPDNGIDDDGNGYTDDVYGWDFGDNDNDPNPSQASPLPPKRFHGTNCGGAACAVTDNGIGIASPGFKTKVMAVKVTEDNDAEQSVKFAYQGIAYAADQGADIINCSFGGAGASNVERAVIEYAGSLGVVVIASAGNDDIPGSDYPAAYPTVLSVAATNASDKKTWFSNYGTDVDVSAPGMSIYMTDGNHGYTSADGTSFSSPIAASVAALVKAYHPDWTGNQVREQVRVSAFPIDHLNPGYEGLLGWGRVDAYRALTVLSPSIRIVDFIVRESDSADQDGIISPGETAEIIFTIQNYLAPSSAVTITFSPVQPDAIVQNPQMNFPDLSTLDVFTNTNEPLRIQIDDQAMPGQEIEILAQIQAGYYTDHDRFSFEIAPDYKTIEAKHVKLTLSSIGRLGFANTVEYDKGVGFVYQGNDNLLFEGSFMAAVSADSVSDAARSAVPSVANHDFNVSNEGNIVIVKPGIYADVEGHTIFNDSSAVNAIGFQVRQTAYAFDNDVDGNYILLSYQITPLSNQSIDALYIGLFMDWDVGQNGLNSGNNLPGFDATLNLAYIYDSSIPKKMHAGLRIFTNNPNIQFASIYNPDEIWDGYTDSEKWHHLSDGIQPITHTDPNDYSHLLGAGPFRLTANDTVLLGFAVLAGESLEDLKNNARAAALQWESLAVEDTVPVQETEPDTNFVLSLPMPNPFYHETSVQYQIPQTGHVTLSVYDVLGREVNRLVDGVVLVNQVEESNLIPWDGQTYRGSSAASGIYFICLQYLTYRKVRKVIFLNGE